MWRVDKYVNAELGNIDLADLYNTDREITVWRTGHVCIDGDLLDPNGISPLMLTAGGGLALPGYDPNEPNEPYMLPSTTLGDAVIGIQFTVDNVTIRVREIVLDGQLLDDPPCDKNLALWRIRGEASAVVWSGLVQTNPRNNRSYIPTNINLFPIDLEPATYRLLARVTEYRGAPPADADWSCPILEVDGSRLCLDPQENICTDPFDGTLDEDNLYMTIRFTELE